MKLLFTIYSKGRGGAEKSTIELANTLFEKFGHKSIVLLGTNHFKTIGIASKKGCIVVKIFLPYFIYKFVSPILILILHPFKGFDHIFLGLRNVYTESLICKKVGIPATLILRAILIDREDANELRNLDSVICISKAVEKRLKAVGYKGKTFVIYNGINYGFR